MQTHTFLAKPIDSGKRLDSFLLEQSALKEIGLTRSKVTQAIETEGVLVNNASSKPSYRLKTNDAITIALSPVKETALTPDARRNIPVLFENEHFVIVDKPAGVQAHPSSADASDTLVNWLIDRYPDITSVGDDALRPGIVHRLDKDTSGLLVIAKNQTAFEELKRLFSERKISKIYTALVHGHINPSEGTLDTPLARAYSLPKQAIATPHTHTRGTIRPALTHYRVLEHRGEYDLVEARPKTGRKHQIRVHLASIGHPIVGDKLYGTKLTRAQDKHFSRHFLHAKELSFSLFGQDYSFESPLPEEFHVVIPKEY